MKRVLLISFYGRVCISTRLLSSILKRNGHETFLFYLKEDRALPVEKPDLQSEQFQFLNPHNGANIYGTGIDVNPISQKELKILQDKALELNPDVIAISSRTVHLGLSRLITKKLREVLPDIRYIAGGYGPSLEPEKFLEFVDFVCVGKGDKAILNLVEDDDPSNCPHVGSISKDGIVKIIPPDDSFDINDRPPLDWVSKNMYMIEDNKIYSLGSKFDTTNYVTTGSEGCISTCTYCQACQWPQIYKMHGGNTKKISMRSPKSVIEELMFAEKEFGIKSISFQDSIFTWNKKWFSEFIALYKEKIKLPFDCFVDSRFTNEDQIKELMECGLYACSVGIQSADENIRKNIMGRNESNENIIKFAHLLKSLNIRYSYDIILWNPFESHKTLFNGIDLLNKLPKSNRICVYQLKIFPKSEISSIYHKEKPQPLSNEEYTYWSWVYVMLLRSKETNSMANELLAGEKKFSDYKKLQIIYEEILNNLSYREKLFTIRDIKKGEVIRPVMFIEKKTEVENTVNGEQRHLISGSIAVRNIPKNTFITYNDFYSSYAGRNK